PRWDGGPVACGSLHTRFAGVPALPTLAPHRALRRHFQPCRECLMNCGRFQARWSSGSLTDDPYVTLLRLLRPTGNGNIRSRAAHLDKLWFLWHSGLLLITVDKQTSFPRGRTMDLPVMPPVKPMLAATAAQIPPGQQYEPKWDGFRAIIFRAGDDVHFRSRNTKPIERYFPELVAAVRAALPRRCVLDGEVVVQNQDGVLDFSALQQRIHPAESRIKKLALQTPATLLTFDCLALD